jgi:hypothetical protein
VDDLHRVAGVLSVPEQTTVVGALNFDDDVLGLSLYGGGEEIDFYLSRPEMLDEPAERMGDADGWCDTLNVPWLKPKVRALFAAEDVTFEHARLPPSPRRSGGRHGRSACRTTPSRQATRPTLSPVTSSCTSHRRSRV